MYAISTLMAMAVTKELVSIYGDGIRVYIRIILFTSIVALIIYLFIVCKKSEYKQLVLLVIFFMLLAFMLISIYLKNLILVIISFISFFIGTSILTKMLENMNK